MHSREPTAPVPVPGIPPRWSPRVRRTAAVAVGGFVLVFGLLHPVRRAMDDSNDFQTFWRAGRAALHGTLSSEDGVERYLPVFQALHAPLGALPAGVAGGLWYAVSLAALAGLPRQLERLSGVAPREQWPAFAILLLLALDNLALGQSAPVLLWLAAFGVARARAGEGLRGGAAIGLAALFKVLPAAALAAPVLLRRARGAIAGFAIAIVVGFGATAALVGAGATLDETGRWLHETREVQSAWGLVGHGRSLRYNNQGLGVTLARTFGDLGDTPAKGAVRLAHWPWPAVWSLYACVLASLVAVGARAALAARRMDPQDGRAWLGLFALSGLGMLLAAPLVWTHYFLWMLPAIVFVRRERRLLLWGGIAFNLALAIPPLRALGFHAWCALGLYVWIARSLWRVPAGEHAGPLPTGGGVRSAEGLA